MAEKLKLDKYRIKAYLKHVLFVNSKDMERIKLHHYYDSIWLSK